MNRSSEAWKKRLALQVVQQLPEDQKDALAVLSYAKELVTGFMCAATRNYPQKTAQARVVELVPESNTPSRFASSSGRPAARPK